MDLIYQIFIYMCGIATGYAAWGRITKAERENIRSVARSEAWAEGWDDASKKFRNLIDKKGWGR